MKPLALFMVAVFLAQTLVSTSAYAASGSESDDFYLQKEGPQLRQGNIFYNSTTPNQLLIKANIWGAVHFPGIHFLPKGTTLLDAVSIAGGPLDNADADHVVVSTVEGGKTQVRDLSLTRALAGKDANPEIRAGDVVVVKRDLSRERTTTWLAIGSLVLSMISVGLMIVNVSKN